MSDPLRQVLRAYYEAEGASDHQSRLYRDRDWIHQRLKAIALDELRARCRPDTVLLDAGCAEGLYLRAAPPMIRAGVGVDLARSKLARGLALARPRGSLHLSVADLEHIPCRAGVFDLVLCLETLEHVPDHRLALAEIWRVMKPGGSLIVSVPTEANELGGDHKRRLAWQAKSGHLHSFSRDAFAARLAATGLRIERVFTIDVLGARLRYAIVASLAWRAARAIWRAWAMRRVSWTGSGPAHLQPDGGPPSATSGSWRRLDAGLTRLPGLRRWSSLALWVCQREQ